MTPTDSIEKILKDCCCEYKSRQGTDSPWIDGEYVYATDGRIMVRTRTQNVSDPDRFAIGGRRCPRNVATDFAWALGDDYEPNPISIEGVTLPKPAEVCHICFGVGEVTCKKCEREGATCPECYGKGMLGTIVSIEIADGLGLSSHYIRLLLSHGVTAVHRRKYGGTTTPVRFEGNGFEGLLMQMELKTGDDQ